MPPERRDRQPVSVARLLVGLFCGLLVFVVAGGAALALFAPAWLAVPGALLAMTGQQVSRSDGSTHGSSLAVDVPGGITPTPSKGTNAPSSTALIPSAPTLLPHRRFTILLLGSDNDRKFPASAVLTQSMIIVSIDPSTRDVAMISIPRDSWVPIPGYGNAKIDVAYEVGGIALARKTVETLFGIHVDYYAWVGLTGLVKVINSLGGIEVTVLHPVLDETYPDDLFGPNPYAYYRLYIPAGPQHLDGVTTLEYVRSRHGDLESDFGRSERQQQVLLAIKNLATDPAMIGRVPSLVTALQGAVKTDLTLPQIVQLAFLARSVHANQIHRQVLSAPRFAGLGWSPDHTEQIVIPHWNAIRPEIATLLHLHDPRVTNQQTAAARSENATIEVRNGTGETDLAGHVSAYLAWQGFHVLTPSNAPRDNYTQSKVIVTNPTKMGTAQVIATILHAQISSTTGTASPADIVVIVGRDHPPIPRVYAP